MTIPVDPQLSFRWFFAAAQREDVTSMKAIGYAYSKGRGVERNLDSSFEWYMKAAERGEPRSQYMIGRCFKKGRGCEIDLVQAMHWYQKSAAQGNQQAIDAVEHLWTMGTPRIIINL
jgi:TPR repeat protein